MPLIPVSNENLRLEVGSPVPIGGSEQARGPGEALEGVGRGLFALGDMLNDARATNNDKQAQLEARLAAAQRKQQLELEQAREASVNPMTDVTGGDYVGKVRERMTRFDEAAKSKFSSPLAAQYYAVFSAENEATETGRMVQFAQGRNVEYRKGLFDRTMELYAEQVAANPALLGAMMDQVELAVNENDMIPVSQVKEQTRAYRANVIQSAAESLASRGETDRAIRLMNAGRAFMPEAEIFAKTTAFENAANTRVQRAYTQIQQRTAIFKDDMEQNRIAAAQEFQRMMQSATSVEERRRVDDLMTSFQVADPDAKAHFDSIRTGGERTAQDLSQQIVATYLPQMINEEGALSIKGKTTAVQKLMNRFNSGKGILRSEEYQTAMQYAAKLRQLAQNPRNAVQRDLLREASSFIKTDGEAYIATLSDENLKAKKRQENQRQIVNMYAEYARNPDMSVDQMRNMIQRYKTGSTTDKNVFNRSGTVPMGEQKDAQTAKEAMRKALIEMQSAKKNGDIKKYRELADKVRILNKQRAK